MHIFLPLQEILFMLRFNLKYLREKYDFTYTQSEKMFGLGRGTYANLEKNVDYKINPSVLLKILGVYSSMEGGLTLERLLTVDLENAKEEITSESSEQNHEDPIDEVLNDLEEENYNFEQNRNNTNEKPLDELSVVELEKVLKEEEQKVRLIKQIKKVRNEKKKV